MNVNDRIKIIENINGDNTLIGTTGKITRICPDGTVIFRLDGIHGEYYTSTDGTDFEVIAD